MSHKSPAFQFYPKDFLSDENVVLMTNQELGCYMKLLCYCWKEGSIPLDIQKIAKLCNEDGAAMALLWSAIKNCFSVCKENPERLVNLRLLKEREKQIEHHKIKSLSGKKGAKAKWNNKLETKKKDNPCHDSANGKAMAAPEGLPLAKNGSSSSSSPSDNKDRDTNVSLSCSEQIFLLIPLCDNSEFAVTEKHVSDWQALYPGVDVAQEVRNYKGWAISKPTKRKTRRGILTSINSWLIDKQDKCTRKGNVVKFETGGQYANSSQPISRREQAILTTLAVCAEVDRQNQLRGNTELG